MNGERVGNGRSRCAVIGRETSRRFSLLDERDAGKGLMILYGKGDPCKPGKRMALLFVLVLLKIGDDANYEFIYFQF